MLCGYQRRSRYIFYAWVWRKKWQGKVKQALPTPEVINNVVLYNVLVDVDNHDRQLMTGMSTQMFFVLGKVSQVPLVPVSVLGERVPGEDSKAGKAYRVKKFPIKVSWKRLFALG